MKEYIEYLNEEKQRVEQTSKLPNGAQSLLEARKRLLKLVASLKDRGIEHNINIGEDLFFGLSDASIFQDLGKYPDDLFDDAKALILLDIEFATKYLFIKLEHLKS